MSNLKKDFKKESCITDFLNTKKAIKAIDEKVFENYRELMNKLLAKINDGDETTEPVNIQNSQSNKMNETKCIMNTAQKKILDIISKFANENPEERFGQLLYNLDINQFENLSMNA